jgi:CelD/BcsL family acetyltransferase involved in cellulose biosynthesis
MTAVDAPLFALHKPPAHDLTVIESDSFEGAGVSREEWDQLVRDVGADLYVTYDWCRIWWRHYGGNRRLRLYIFRAGERLVGLAPMFIERVRIGPVSLRIAKRVGADFALTIFVLPLTAEYVEIAYRELMKRLIDGANCDAVWFGFVPGTDPTLSGLREACCSLKNLVTVARDAPAGPHTSFHLPETFDAYLASLNKRQRQNYRRDVNFLNKHFEVGRDIVKDSARGGAAFAQFKIMHDKQWLAEGKLGHFGDWPYSESFNTDLVTELSRLGRFRMVHLLADQKIVSSQYAFVFGNCCYWRLPARAVDERLERFGLGRLGLMALIEAMISEGVRQIEAGVGHYDYKVQLGGKELQIHTLLVVSRRRGVVSRARLFLKFADLLHLVYYRVWRLRVAPRLPLPIGSLWRIWIRFRI